MLTEIRKKCLRYYASVILICAVVIGGCMYITGGGILKLIRGPVDLYGLDTADLNGQYVSADIYFIYDYFSYETTRKENEIKAKVTARDYIIPVGEDSYMALTISGKRLSMADDLMSASQQWMEMNGDDDSILDGTDFVVKGTIMPLKGESLQYYHEYLEYDQLSVEDQARFLPYSLKVNYIGKTDFILTYVGSAITAIALLITLICIINFMRKKYEKPIRAFCENHGGSEMMMEQLEQFYSSSVSLNRFRFSSKWYFYQNGTRIILDDLSNLLWVYQKTVHHKRNGIPTGNTYSVLIYTRDKKTHTFNVSNDAQAKEIITYIAGHVPHVITGYSSDLEKLYKQDFDRMAALADQIEPA